MINECPKSPGESPEYGFLRTGNVRYQPNFYKGSKEDLAALAALSSTREFQEKYPNHTVVAVGRDIIGFYDNKDFDPVNSDDPGIRRVQDAMFAIFRETTLRGITTWNCAIIQTGPERIIDLCPPKPRHL